VYPYPPPLPPQHGGAQHQGLLEQHSRQIWAKVSLVPQAYRQRKRRNVRIFNVGRVRVSSVSDSYLQLQALILVPIRPRQVRHRPSLLCCYSCCSVICAVRSTLEIQPDKQQLEPAASRKSHRIPVAPNLPANHPNGVCIPALRDPLFPLPNARGFADEKDFWRACAA